MIPKRIDDVSWADLDQLRTDARPEDRQLEYKRDVVGGRDDDKKEFLADVSAMANASGGDIIFGVEEAAGLPIGTPGLPSVSDPDKEILRLEQLARDGLAPRVAGLQIRWVPKPATTTGALLLRVPASFAAPHRVVFQRWNRFFARTSAGKYEMDVHELREAFNASEGLPERVKGLHAATVELIRSAELPFTLTTDPKAVLSVIPLSTVRQPYQLSLSPQAAVTPPFAGSVTWVHGLEGLYYYQSGGIDRSHGFALTQRTGQVDVVWRIGGESDRGERVIYPKRFEDVLLASVQQAVRKLQALEVEGPFFAAVTILNAKAHRIVADTWTAGQPAASAKDKVVLPPILVEGDHEAALLPLAELFWFAFHEERPSGVAVGKMA